MVDDKAVVPASGDPPLDAAYHCTAVPPVVERLATVPELQNDCVVLTAGAAGVVSVTATAVLVDDSHPLMVCEA